MVSNKVKYIDDMIIHARTHLKDGNTKEAEVYIDLIRLHLPRCHEGYKKFLEKTYKKFFEEYIYKR